MEEIEQIYRKYMTFTSSLSLSPKIKSEPPLFINCMFSLITPLTLRCHVGVWHNLYAAKHKNKKKGYQIFTDPDTLYTKTI